MYCMLRFYMKTRRAKRYKCGSDMILFFDICNEITVSQDNKRRRVGKFLLLCLGKYEDGRFLEVVAVYSIL